MATKKTAKKATMSNIDKIKKTAQNINNEVIETVKVVRKDVKKNRSQAVSSFEKMQMKDSVKQITSAVKNVNAQVVETASEILDETYQNGKKWGNNLVETAKENVAKIDVTVGINQVQSTIKNVNAYTLETAEDLLDGSVKTGEKWQGLTKKAIKETAKLAERQQDIVFDTLETVKGQLVGSAKRLRKIFSNN